MIPDAPIREDALSSIERKRGHTDGAALFWILPRRRNLELLRLLVAYEMIWDFLDTLNEHGADRGQANGRQLHLALVEAVDPSRSISDYYRTTRGGRTVGICARSWRHAVAAAARCHPTRASSRW